MRAFSASVTFPRGYRRLTRNWRDPGYTLKNLGGDPRPEFLSFDGRFGAAFTAYAASIPPVQIFRYRDGALTDVTRRFRSLVARDTKSSGRLVRRLRKEGEDMRGALAAYVAGKHLLGQRSAGWRVAYAALRRGDLAPRTPSTAIRAAAPTCAPCAARCATGATRARRDGASRGVWSCARPG